MTLLLLFSNLKKNIYFVTYFPLLPPLDSLTNTNLVPRYKLKAKNTVTCHTDKQRNTTGSQKRRWLPGLRRCCCRTRTDVAAGVDGGASVAGNPRSAQLGPSGEQGRSSQV